MRFGCCCNMIATKADGIGIEWIKILKEYGYDYVELPLAQITELTDDKFNELIELLNKEKIRCEVCNNFFPTNIRLTGNNINNNLINDYINKALDRAAKLGVDIIVFGSGPAKNVPEEFDKKSAWNQIVYLLRDISYKINNLGIQIAIEPLRKEECNIINTVEEAYKLTKDINRDNIRVLVDYYHLREEKEDPKILLTVRENLNHIHFARPDGRRYPKLINEDEYEEFINCVRESGYMKRVSIEAYSNDVNNDAENTIKFFKKYFSN